MRGRATAIRLELRRNYGSEPDPSLVATLERALDFIEEGKFREQLVLPDGHAESALGCIGRFRLERFVDTVPD